MTQADLKAGAAGEAIEAMEEGRISAFDRIEEQARALGFGMFFAGSDIEAMKRPIGKGLGPDTSDGGKL